jgi:hypothetical protein
MATSGLFLVCLATVPPAPAQAPFNPTPDWVSSTTGVATGAALVDLDLDGWLDLVIANGNDITRGTIDVYYNRGDGTFPLARDWASAEARYHGHIDVADVNGDGWPDVAVGLLLNEGLAAARLHLNHNGVLSTTPDWISDERARAFAVAFGDVNNDGRPDLAVATGWPYDPGFEARNTVHLNVGGQLETTASWQSDDLNHYLGVLWTDADNDGRLDLVGVGTNTHTWLYHNNAGTLETTASWHSADNSGQFGIMAVAGDVTGDGLRELFVTDNTQVFSGSGLFRQYTGLPGGNFTTTPTWSYFDGYGSAAALVDVNGDGPLDLVTGAWWDSARVFYNSGQGLPAQPSWSSTATSVIEKIVFGDIDKNGLRTIVETFAPAPMDQRLFYLAHQPVQEVVSVKRGGQELPPSEYTFSREFGWATVGHPFTETVEITYTYSSRPDMAISNWDGSLGNYVYYNLLVLKGDANCDGTLDAFDIEPFIDLLVDPNRYRARFPDCDGERFCDMNDDGAIDAFDIEPFINALIP